MSLEDREEKRRNQINY